MQFAEQVYALTKQIPKGNVSTYKIIAEALGTKAYRAVGMALKKNKDPITIPCYRVIKDNGEIGGYGGSDPLNIQMKAQKLHNDGIEIIEGKIDTKYFFIHFIS